MNHTSLVLGAIIIFLLAGIGYTTIPGMIKEAQNETTTVLNTQEEQNTLTESVDENVEPVTPVNQLSDTNEYEYEDEEDEYEEEDDVSPPPQTSSPTSVTTPAPAPVTTPAPVANGYTLAQVAQHADNTSCWSAINGSVYDLTSYIKKHPGGSKNILKICGKDGSAAFTSEHGGERKPESILSGYRIGPLI